MKRITLRRFLSTISKFPSDNQPAKAGTTSIHLTRAAQKGENSEMPDVDLQDLNGLTTGQRAALALDLMPDLIKEAEARKAEIQTEQRGPGRPPSKTGKAAAKAAKTVGIGRTSVETAIAIQKRDPAIIERMRSGELNVAQAARAVGLFGLGGGSGHLSAGEKDALGRYPPRTYYGKGDKWKEAAGPLLRYLTAWERKGYEFRHVNPKEARRRLALISELQEKLDAAKVDLEQRAHSATLTIRQKG